MWALIKLLTSLSQSLPIFRDVLTDIISMLQSWRAAKDEAVSDAVADAKRRLRDEDLR